jgi:hypothetical protein
MVILGEPEDITQCFELYDWVYFHENAISFSNYKIVLR